MRPGAAIFDEVGFVGGYEEVAARNGDGAFRTNARRQELEKLKQFNPQQQERILKKLFDTEGGRPAAIFLKKGMEGFTEALANMDKQASLNERVGESLGTLRNRWDAERSSRRAIATRWSISRAGS